MTTKEMIEVLKESERYGYVTLFSEVAFEIIDRLEEYDGYDKLIKLMEELKKRIHQTPKIGGK